jgi:hypothetical protein
MQVCQINVKAEKPIFSLDITCLDGTRRTGANNYHYKLEYQWHQLCVYYQGAENNIKNISINGVDLDHYLFTGWVEDKQGNTVQPATTLWEEGTVFKIWFHPNWGEMYSRWLSELPNGVYGADLNASHSLLVDKPVSLPNLYPVDIREYFNHSTGPHWYKKARSSLPYKKIDNDLSFINKDLLQQQVKDLSVYYGLYDDNDNWRRWSYPKSQNLVTEPIDPLIYKDTEIEKIVNNVGYKSVLYISLQTLEPQTYIDIHTDNYDKLPLAWQRVRGCAKFYWSMSDTKDVYFKFANVGCLPTHHPLMINACDYAHGVVNNSDTVRTILLIYGGL